MLRQLIIVGTLALFSCCTLAHPVAQDSDLHLIRLFRRQIITTDVANCGGNHSNTVGRARRQIITADVLNCGGNHANKVKRNVHTNPDNIRVIVGNTQPFPIARGSSNNGGPPSTGPAHNRGGAGSSGGITGDSGNIGGVHQDNIAIGGIQNFGGQYNDLIAKLTGDTNNKGGVHSNNVAIGGILNFP